MRPNKQFDEQHIQQSFLNENITKEQPYRFGNRLRQIRKDLGETQDEFAARIGITKQVLSRYENGLRIPKASFLEQYARALDVSVDYLMGISDVQESAYKAFCVQEDRPFYQIFVDVLDKMDMTKLDVVRLTGLTPWQVETIETTKMQEAPLSLALRLSKALEVPLEVWTGNEEYKKAELSPDARLVARAYDQASDKDKAVVRTILEIPPREGAPG